LDDLDELAGFVAAEANHAKDKKLQKELDQLCDRIQATLDGYTGRGQLIQTPPSTAPAVPLL